MKYWQDLAKTIEATKDGDPVGVIEGCCTFNGCPKDLIIEGLMGRATVTSKGTVPLNGHTITVNLVKRPNKD